MSLSLIQWLSMTMRSWHKHLVITRGGRRVLV
ncbi:hypothetical protein TorRG33x02_178180 [Trema orientale]|uniref:Uncharacterized protein n=1 Tax=Trema orientale TaxID=63057 RepID=A0A2P5ELD5_TREOI|nr:hypothetical protein TorRG33x02_178180 [Trema orientale]